MTTTVKVGGWIDQLLAAPGAVSFMAYRTADGASPNTMTLLEFGTAEEARKATASEPLTAVLQGLRSLGITPTGPPGRALPLHSGADPAAIGTTGVDSLKAT